MNFNMDSEKSYVVLNAQSLLRMYSIIKNSDPYIVDMTHDQLRFGIEHFFGLSEGKALKGEGGKFIFPVTNKAKWLLAQITYGFE